ncbi:MAG TPA: hypothetical protein VM509_07495 [Planctomycetota bacterium]|nr:hypothetical protein [Planctomycetota bacterium]
MLLCAGAAPLRAQGGAEFTRQGLLIPNFLVSPGVKHDLAKKAADEVRSRTGKLSNKREVDVIAGFEISDRLQRASYPSDTALSEIDVRVLGRDLRADEYLIGRVERAGRDSVRISAQLVLMRDPRLKQPLPVASGPGLDEAAEQLARALVAARAQLIPMRRCENSLRDGKGSAAIAAARAGINAYRQSTLARTCLLWALRGTSAPASDLLSAAEQVLAVDSLSFHGLDAAATALDSLSRHGEAANYWLRLVRTDTSDMDLAQRVLWSLTEAGSWKQAEAFATRVSDAHPDILPLLRAKWRSAFENRHWEPALAAGEAMLQRDTTALRDPMFFRRLATAYRSAGQPIRSLEIVARGVAAFPKEPGLYALYTQFVREEADTVLPRGLALFPKSADLLALNARALRAQGKVAESLESMKSAIAVDSTLSQGQLMIAQAHFELGRPDSALVALQTALARGEDSTRVAQFAFARGNALYRAANGTKTSSDFALALRFLAFADSVRSSSQSRFLVGAAALGVAQRALTEAPADKDRAHSCALAQLGSEMIPVARSGIEAGQDVMPDAARQSLDYLTQIEPFAGKQIAAYCGAQ